MSPALYIFLICWAVFVGLVYIHMLYDHFLADKGLGTKLRDMLVEEDAEEEA